MDRRKSKTLHLPFKEEKKAPTSRKRKVEIQVLPDTRIIAHKTVEIQSNIPTNAVPVSLLKSLPAEESRKQASEFCKAKAWLQSVLGKPFHADNGFILYNGDCLAGLKSLLKGPYKIPLTVTSPPYNIGKTYESLRPVEEYISWCLDWISCVYSITAKYGAFWLNLGYLPVPGKGKAVPIPYLLWDKTPFYMLQEVVWNYGAGVSAKKSFSPRNEKWIFFVSDHEQYTFNLDSVRDPNVKYPNQKKNGRFRCNPLGKNPTDVWQIPKVTTGKNRSSKERTSHPAQFPLSIAERAIRVSSNAGDLVLDPFSGTRSSSKKRWR